jgi:hypothetical protein
MGCRVRTVLNEEPCEIYTTIFRRLVQRSQPTLILGCYIRAVFNE